VQLKVRVKFRCGEVNSYGVWSEGRVVEDWSMISEGPESSCLEREKLDKWLWIL
jgi:hypothetical protein